MAPSELRISSLELLNCEAFLSPERSSQALWAACFLPLGQPRNGRADSTPPDAALSTVALMKRS